MGVVLKSFFVFFLFVSCSYAEEYNVKKIISGLSITWGMAFIDDTTMILTQKEGKVFLLNTQTKKLTSVQNPPQVHNLGQGGLLDVQASPNYKKDGWIYFTYVNKIYKWDVTVLVRAKLKDNRLHSWDELLVTKSATKNDIHFGSRITFDNRGYLYFGVGDRGERPNGQDINTHAGAIMRLYPNGDIPERNPFVRKEGLDEIYSFGHRNPQGLFYDKKRNILFECEHGPRGGDEINIIQKEGNYGWPMASFGKEYWSNNYVGMARSYKGMIDPIKVYTPSIAPSSLMVYSGKLFKQWEGDLFLGALALKHINKITLDKDNKVIKEERLFEELDKRVRNIIEAPDGSIYFSTDSGEIYQVAR